ncbi:MAG: hypothetical protein CUR33_16725 [Pseudomonas sp.]|nr:MAG: hypothetical protein CUR33_16725 [Pseudomonas sp.] [Pseudomonas sp. FEMGT703P]
MRFWGDLVVFGIQESLSIWFLLAVGWVDQHFSERGVCWRHYQSTELDHGGSMEPIGYFILGTVLAIALIGTVGFLFTKLLERKLNSQKP